MRIAARVDTNHSEVVQAFRACGYSVLSLAGVGAGCPDLLIARGGKTALIEIKFEKGKLRESQEVFSRDWNGRIEVARTLADVERIASTWHR